MINLNKNADNSSTELDFIEHWSFFNIQQEVIRGLQLREEKPNTNKTQNAFQEIELNLPSCSKKFYSGNPTSFRPKYRSPKAKKKTTVKKCLKRKTKRQQCPLRVIELAEPLKRRCLYTWQNNGHILPDYMIERLRNYIMDEKPIVRISDAVSCFKNRKKISKKRKLKNQTIKHRNKQFMSLWSIFAYRIIKKLLKPANIVLNPKLENVRNIVSDEIKRVLRSNKKDVKFMYKNDKILTEVSNKVTMWIASVLEESSDNLLLEQLEDLEEKEGPVLDLLDDLVDTITCDSSTSAELSEDCSSESKSLSSVNDVNTIHSADKSNIVFITTDKQETMHITPVSEDQHQPEIEDKIYLDNERQTLIEKFYTDDHIDNSDNIIQEKPNIKPVSEYQQQSTIEHKIDLDDEIIENISTRGYIDNYSDSTTNVQDIRNITPVGDNQQHYEHNEPQQVNENISMKDHLKSLLEERINIVVNGENNRQIDNNQIAAIGGNTNLSSVIEDNMYHLPLESQEREINDDHLLSSLVVESIKVLEQDEIIDTSLENNFKMDSSEDPAQEHQNHNGSEKFTNGEMNDSLEENKKVKFSDINMDIQRSRLRLNMYTSDVSSHILVDWKSSQEYILSHYSVAPPNPNLLSFVDEVWPENILPPLIKCIESVSRSVTSLGRIPETDEYSVKSVNDNNLENIERLYSSIITTIDMTKTPEVYQYQSLEKSSLDFAHVGQVSQNWQEINNSEKLALEKYEDNEKVEISQGYQDEKIKFTTLIPVGCKEFTNQETKELSHGFEENNKVRIFQRHNDEKINFTAVIPVGCKESTNEVTKELSHGFEENGKVEISQGYDDEQIKFTALIPVGCKESTNETTKELSRGFEENGKVGISQRRDDEKIKFTALTPIGCKEYTNQATKELSHEFEENGKVGISHRHDEENIKATELIPVGCKAFTNEETKELSEQYCYKAGENITPINFNNTVQTSYTNYVAKDTEGKNIQNEVSHAPCKSSIVCDMRIWIIDLENIANSLELWVLWIQNVCLSVMRLKENPGEPTRTHIKEWIKLNRNIDFDVQIWSHIHSRLFHGLNKHRRHYFKKKKASTMQVNKKTFCKCKKDYGHKKVCSQILLQYYDIVDRKV